MVPDTNDITRKGIGVTLLALAGIVCLAMLARALTSALLTSARAPSPSPATALASTGVATAVMLAGLWLCGMRGLLRTGRDDLCDVLRIDWLPLCLTTIASVFQTASAVGQDVTMMAAPVRRRISN